MTPWVEGCRRLAARLGVCLETYSASICETVIDRCAGQPVYLTRLWRCLRHHWKQAVEMNVQTELPDVVERIQAGQGYRGGGQLGGNPLRDVVLAVAMTRRDENAPRVFHSDYFDFSRRLAAKLDRHFYANPDEWWTDLLDVLAGYTNPPGKLEKFGGESALQNWLGTVLWNFLRCRVRKPTNTVDIEDVSQPHSRPNDDLVVDESLRWFVELTRESFNALSSDDRLIISLVFLDGLKQNEASPILGVHPGNVSKKLKKAIERFQDHHEKIASKFLRHESYEGILQQLGEDPRAFAIALRNALEEKRED